MSWQASTLMQRPLHLLPQRAHNQAVEAEARSSMIAGHILALPFSDRYADSLQEAVLNTGLHRALDNDARFSMAAHVERTGVAFACCVWVYIACTAAV
jgi:coiled-coil and C2 domain-containing protein 2A